MAQQPHQGVTMKAYKVRIDLRSDLALIGLIVMEMWLKNIHLIKMLSGGQS